MLTIKSESVKKSSDNEKVTDNSVFTAETDEILYLTRLNGTCRTIILLMMPGIINGHNVHTSAKRAYIAHGLQKQTSTLRDQGILNNDQ